MRDLLLFVLIGVAGYLPYDDFYNQRPALQQAQAEIQQLRENPAPVAAKSPYPVYVPVNPSKPPAWFQKRVEQGSSLDTSRQHTHKDEGASTPAP